jgi:DNA-directed RNA polymerase specialized sigma24 family protein
MTDERFPKTSWTLIARAGNGSPDGRAALSSLCSLYWFPVYAFIRRQGGSPEDAYDRTQGFFVQLLERNSIAKVDRDFGSKFRSWLLRCVKNYLASEHAYAHAQRRLPPENLESLSPSSAEERYEIEPSHDLNPERLYERQFALSLLGSVADKLRAKYVLAGREHVFDALKGCLSGETGQEKYDDLAVTLGLGSVGAVRKAAFDLRAQYKNLLRTEVSSLVDSQDEVVIGRELRHLLEAISDEQP